MYRKMSTLLLAVIVMTLTMSVAAFAQYSVSNNSVATITISLQIACPGPPPISYITAPVVVSPGVVVLLPTPPPPCGVTYVIVNGTSYYPMGYNGPATLPNPPTWVTVTSTGATIW